MSAHTIRSITQFLNEHITSAIRAKFSASDLMVGVEGVLGDIKQNNEYKYHYGVKLKDESDYVLLDIPKELIDKSELSGGEYVQVLGTIKTKLDSFSNNRVEFRIDVSRINTKDSPKAIEAMKKDQATISKIHSLHPGRRPFPYKSMLKVSLLVSKSSQVEDDFMYELRSLSDNVDIDRKPINITRKEDIAAAINESSGDIIVIIRGGGDEGQFEVFNQMIVIEALAKNPGYRILGLGHSNDSTLIELVSDYAANTPAQAGTHIKEMISLYREKTGAINKLLSSLEAERMRFESALININALTKRATTFKNMAIFAGIIAVVMLIILLLK
jgi:exodeoxyribonuclease VII large subunit